MVFLIDGMNAYYRSYHKMSHLKDDSDLHTGGIFGFLKLVFQIQKKYPNSKINVLWDSPNNFRYSLYPEYKKTRRDRRDPDEYKRIKAGINPLKDLLSKMEVDQYEADGFEADDLAGFLTQNLKYDELTMVTTDHDWFQLLDERVFQLKPVKDSREIGLLVNPEYFKNEFGYPCKNITIFKSIKGDQSDNIKGVLRFPTKFANVICSNIDNIDGLFDRENLISLGVTEKWVDAIFENKMKILLNYKLVKMPVIPRESVKYLKGQLDRESLNVLYKKYDFKVFFIDDHKKGIDKLRSGSFGKRGSNIGKNGTAKTSTFFKQVQRYRKGQGVT